MLIPFAPFPLPILRKLSEPFHGIGSRIAKMFPFVQTDLITSDIELNSTQYCSIMFFSFLLYFVLFSFIVSLFLGKFITTATMLGPIRFPNFLLIGITVGFVVALLVFLQMLTFPKIRTKRRIREIEKNLVFALRTILVQIKSGVTLFDSLYLVSSAKRYGQLSIELKETVDAISTGVAEETALQELAAKNPSTYLRKVCWQIVNGMKAGADTSDVLGESVSSIMREQQIEIQKYGNSLKILSLIYLMIGIIIPALGLTFLIVIGSFPKININELMFWGMMGGIIVVEFMFVGLMKSKRPNLMSG
jgi:flagellar protein FlaJ